MNAKTSSFSDFYVYYLAEHVHPTCRRLHFFGSWCALAALVAAIVLADPRYLLLALLCGYGFAWAGHFFFEKNRPATFKHPFFSFLGEWVMFRDILVGKIRL